MKLNKEYGRRPKPTKHGYETGDKETCAIEAVMAEYDKRGEPRPNHILMLCECSRCKPYTL